MIGLAALFELFKSNPTKYLKIGGMVLVAILVIGYVGYTQIRIYSLETQTENLKIQKDTAERAMKLWQARFGELQTSVEVQNTKVRELAERSATLDSKYSDAKSKIAKMDEESSKQALEILNSTSVPNSCPPALEWMTEDVQRLLNNWNKGETK